MNGPPAPAAGPLLAVEHLEVCFATAHGLVPVVTDVSFTVDPGEVVGLVGESGCGKSVTSLAVMGLIPDPPGRITGGRITFEGDELTALGNAAMQRRRGNRLAMVFQEPMTSLDPAFTVGEQIASTYRRHRGGTKREAWDRAIEMLDLVGIPGAKARAGDHPHAFSGGMRQRVVIAIALVCSPSLLIADEPTTALDVTIQAQVLDLLRDLQQRLGMAIVFVSHDLGVVSELCDRVLVMYAGEVVETAPARRLFDAPRHPYTSGLIACRPSERPGTTLRPIPGTVPAAGALPEGCHFHPRCAHAELGRCDTTAVELLDVAPGRSARCVRTAELQLPGVAPP